MRIWQVVKKYWEKGENEMEQLFGSKKSVNKLANSWDNTSEELQIMAIHCLNEYTTNNNFEKKELIAYKKGLNEIPKILMKCFKEER